jgi:hypothetical protein
LLDRRIAASLRRSTVKNAAKEFAMLTTLKTAVIAGVIGLASLAAVPAKADSLYLGFGDRGNDTRFGVYVGDNDRPHYPDARRDWRRDEWRHNSYRERRGCSPDRALDKAEAMGIRRARISFVSERRIGVVGRQHGDRVRVTFARVRGCPIIGY